MTKIWFFFVAAALLAAGSVEAAGQEFGRGERRDLLKIETADLPRGDAVIGGGEREIGPGGRSPWHTSGPKLLYVLNGALNVEGTGGEILATCGPAPKLCLFNPHKSPWFFRNAGQVALKFVVIGIDPKERQTVHELAGRVVAISGNRVRLAVGDVHISALAVPAREVTVTIDAMGSIVAGDDVVTTRYSEEEHKAEGLVILTQRWR